MLYETGAVEQALLELEDEEVALRGNAEVRRLLLAVEQAMHNIGVVLVQIKNPGHLEPF